MVASNEEEAGTKRILPTEDPAAFRKAPAFTIEREPHYEVTTTQAGSVSKARASEGTSFDVAVVDLALCPMGTIRRSYASCGRQTQTPGYSP